MASLEALLVMVFWSFDWYSNDLFIPRAPTQEGYDGGLWWPSLEALLVIVFGSFGRYSYFLGKISKFVGKDSKGNVFVKDFY